MSMNVALLHHVSAPRQSVELPQAAPIRILKARSLAQRNLTKRERAVLAAAWLDNLLLLLPTVELASEVFGVSYPLIANARLQRPASLPPRCLLWGWLKSSEAERAAFVDEAEADIWGTLQTVTDHQR